MAAAHVVEIHLQYWGSETQKAVQCHFGLLLLPLHTKEEESSYLAPGVVTSDEEVLGFWYDLKGLFVWS